METLEATQTVEQRVATYALKQEERAADQDCDRAREGIAQTKATGAQSYSRKGGGKGKAGIIMLYVKKVTLTWTAELDVTIMRMRADGITFANIALRLGNGLKTTDIKNRWHTRLKALIQCSHGIGPT